MSERLFSSEIGWVVANEVMGKIWGACERFEVAGSLRRGCGAIHDVDVVILPRYDALRTTNLFGDVTVQYVPRLLKRALEAAWGYGPYDEGTRMVRLAVRFVPVDLYLAEPGGGNFEALLQMRTGCAEHNRALAVRAMRLGLRYVAGHGIFRGDERVDDGTEEGIYRALGLQMDVPERRGGVL